MAHLALWAVAFFGIFTVITALPPEPEDPNFVAFIARLYQKFCGYAAQHGRKQFAFMVVLTQAQLKQYNPVLYPADHTGAPKIDWNQPISPANPDNFDNFIVAVPTGEGPESEHSEQKILPYTEKLLEQFRERSGEPAAIILYTNFAPCDKCINITLNHLGAENLKNIQRAVVFSNWQDERDVERGEKVFPKNGIYFYRIKERCLKCVNC